MRFDSEIMLGAIAVYSHDKVIINFHISQACGETVSFYCVCQYMAQLNKKDEGQSLVSCSLSYHNKI